jgi:hypothetical protein
MSVWRWERILRGLVQYAAAIISTLQPAYAQTADRDSMKNLILFVVSCGNKTILPGLPHMGVSLYEFIVKN